MSVRVNWFFDLLFCENNDYLTMHNKTMSSVPVVARPGGASIASTASTAFASTTSIASTAPFTLPATTATTNNATVVAQNPNVN